MTTYDQYRNNVWNAIRIMNACTDVDFKHVFDALDACEFDKAIATLDALDVPNPDGLMPPPAVVIRSEIHNAKRYYDL